jgi:endonuclease YncB( thermonuclease family)
LITVALCSVACPGAAFADFTGRVVSVQDGDRLTVLVEKKQVRVRLEGIDAPEPGQAFNKNSRESLAKMCAGKPAEVRETGTDRFRRTLGWVTCAGVEANSEQVRRGMAWVFGRYATPTSPLYELEAYARLRGIGLWVDAAAMAPWEWRAVKRRTKPAK